MEQLRTRKEQEARRMALARELAIIHAEANGLTWPDLTQAEQAARIERIAHPNQIGTQA